METKTLDARIGKMEERIKRLEEWKPPSRGFLLDQLSENTYIADAKSTRDILKRTSGVISKQQAQKWLRAIKKSRKSWHR